MSGRELLIYLSLKYEGNFDAILRAIKDKEKVDDKEIKEKLKDIKCSCLTILDENYPIGLKNINMPPLVLYYYGDVSLLNDEHNKLAVVGSRESSAYGERVTKELVSGVSSEAVIVSGLARGIDSIAHKAAIDAKGKTIAIIGSGIDYIYPKENKELYETIKKEHLLISEYPNSVKPKPDNFPLRNRIIAGLSKKVLVTEAYKNSGTNITVLFALKQGKDVLAVPYPAGKESSCNKLIQDGAFLVETSDDVLYYLK